MTPDIGEWKHGRNAQSVAAFNRIAPHISERQATVLECIKLSGTGGMTNREIANALSWEISQVSGRRTELLAKQLVRENGQRRKGGGVTVAIEFAEPEDSNEIRPS